MNLFDFLAQHHGAVFLVELSYLVALTASLRYYDRHKTLRIFPYYLFIGLGCDAVLYADFVMLGPDEHSRLTPAYLNFYTVLEFYVFAYFILQNLRSLKRRRVVRIGALLYILILFTYWIRRPDYLLQPGISYIYEVAFLLIMCLLYYHELYSHTLPENLTNQPSFWVVTGILIYSAPRIPLLLSGSILGKYGFLALDLNFILSAIFYVMLIRAYSCKPAIAAGRTHNPFI